MDSGPTLLTKMKSGYAHIGDNQFLPGYCLLFADPLVGELTDLNIQGRTEFLRDMSLIGDAIISIYKPVRINYGILGNSYPYLHAHLFPRFDWEPEERRQRNVWTYPEEYWTSDEHAFDEQKHGEKKKQLIEALQELMEKVY